MQGCLLQPSASSLCANAAVRADTPGMEFQFFSRMLCVSWVQYNWPGLTLYVPDPWQGIFQVLVWSFRMLLMGQVFDVLPNKEKWVQDAHRLASGTKLAGHALVLQCRGDWPFLKQLSLSLILICVYAPTGFFLMCFFNAAIASFL